MSKTLIFFTCKLAPPPSNLTHTNMHSSWLCNIVNCVSLSANLKTVIVFSNIFFPSSRAVKHPAIRVCFTLCTLINYGRQLMNEQLAQVQWQIIANNCTKWCHVLHKRKVFSKNSQSNLFSAHVYHHESCSKFYQGM